MDVSPCLFDIQGKKPVGKTQQRIPDIVNTNMPVVQRNKHSELGEGGRRGINSPDTCILQQKPQLLLFKQTWPGNARRSKCYLQPGREQRICLQVAEVIRKPGQIVGDVVACLKMGHFPSWPFLDGTLVS